MESSREIVYVCFKARKTETATTHTVGIPNTRMEVDSSFYEQMFTRELTSSTYFRHLN